MNRSEFGQCMAIITESTQKPLSTAALEVWFELLKDLDLNHLKAACISYASDGDDWPTVAKIRRLATEQRYGITEDFGSVWKRIHKAVYEVWHPDGLDDNLERLQRVLIQSDYELIRRLGGFSSIHDTPTDQQGTLRAQAKSMYESSSFQTRRMLNLPEQVRPKHFIETLDRSAVQSIAAKLTLREDA